MRHAAGPFHKVCATQYISGSMIYVAKFYALVAGRRNVFVRLSRDVLLGFVYRFIVGALYCLRAVTLISMYNKYIFASIYV